MVELYNFYFAGHVDLRDVTITSGVPVIAFVNNSRTEWVTVVALKSGRAPQLKCEFRRHSLSDVRNERNNAALHKAEIAVPSHKAAEIE